MYEQKMLSKSEDLAEARQIQQMLDVLKHETGYHTESFSLPRVSGTWNQTLTVNSVLLCLEYSGSVNPYSATKRSFLINNFLEVTFG
jgi:hypothetical protein